MYLSCMSLFSKLEVAIIQNVGVFHNQISMSEVHITDFLNEEVANQILQMQVVEVDDSIIHISYCLNQILQIDDQAKRVFSLILQKSRGTQRDIVFWTFFMIKLQSLLSGMLVSYESSGIVSDLPKLFDFEEQIFMDHVDLILFGCWEHYVFMHRLLKAEYAYFQIQGGLKIQEDIQVLVPELQKPDFQSPILMF
ncbi:hypothetical protein GOP47_0015237 [Adiantum capillus-veneris]|uniref:Uncharacterized protein n=1 Tax=Adiantum capillus-veneris TaxID=13818 RepID=A0A9D4ZDT5_ADICA|nr:hypothetical protein GOP47_0015237 [Adiantum capillus-veneris]